MNQDDIIDLHPWALTQTPSPFGNVTTTLGSWQAKEGGAEALSNATSLVSGDEFLHSAAVQRLPDEQVALRVERQTVR